MSEEAIYYLAGLFFCFFAGFTVGSLINGMRRFTIDD